MTIKEILYSGVTSLSERLADVNGPLGVLINDTPPENQDELITVFDKAQIAHSTLKKSFLKNSPPENLPEFRDFVEKLTSISTKLPDSRVIELGLAVTLINKITSEAEGDLDLTSTVDTDLFALTKVEKSILKKNHVYDDTLDLKNSFILFDLRDTTSLNDFLTTSAIDFPLLLIFLSKIGTSILPLELAQYALTSKEVQDKQSLIRSAISLQIVKSGDFLHTPADFDRKPSISATTRLVIGKKYQQFNETLTILSEYNHQKDILDKYVRLYHVIENFMFKFPLVKLERRNDGNAFSIRDFKRMYNEVKQNELEALKALIKKIFVIDLIPGKSFETFTYERWGLLQELIDTSRINKVLDRLDISQRFSVVKGEWKECFPLIVYRFRNSIVHYTETEFHLTHESLLHHPVFHDAPNIILGQFLIPSLEEMIFHLIMVENELVWYKKPSLTLFDE